MKLCPLCGKRVMNLVENICKECHLSRYELKIKEIKIKKCILCNKYLYKNKWSGKDIRDIIADDITKKNLIRYNKSILDNITIVKNDSGLKSKAHNIDKKFQLEVIVPQIQSSGNTSIKQGASITAEAVVKIDENEYLIPFKIIYAYCEKCSKADTTYLEGILQIRNPTEELLKFVEDDIKMHNRKGVFVTKVERLSTGIDYYITSKSYLRNIGRRLKKRFNGEVKASAKIFTRDSMTSKDVYMVNVLFRLS